MSLPNSDLPTSILFCRLCQSLYRHPRTLPCLHSFCLDCLHHLAPATNAQGHTTLACPLCGQQTPLPRGGVAALICNEFLARMCQEYVGEVQKTLVSGRPLSSAGTTLRQESMSPTSILAGRAPASHFQYPSPSHLQASALPVATSPAGVQVHRDRVLSPPRSPLVDQTIRGRQSPWRASPGLQHAISPSPSPGYMSPSGLPSSPRHPHSTSTPSEVVLQTARRLSSEMLPSRGVGVQRRLSSTPHDVVRTWECLQHKLNSLQSASLQVTYSLETVNMAEANWHQRKQDLRRDVQRRSAQLQFFIKRQERLLLAALDAKKTDDSFNAAAEQGRSELRVNLKALMHETDVLRSVLDLATDSEIMSLSTLLLSSTVSQIPVTMATPELRFIVPEEVSLEDMVGRDFGCLTSTLVTHSIFTPEDIVQQLPEKPEEEETFSVDTSVNASSPNDAASLTTSDNFEDNFEDVAYIDEDEEDEMVVEETLEFIDGKMQVVSKRSFPPSNTQSTSQGRVQHQGAAGSQNHSKDQSIRGRGTDIRRTVNSSAPEQSKEDVSQVRRRHRAETTEATQVTTEDKADSDSQPNGSHPQNSIEKFQNLRESLKQKRRELLLNTPLFPPQGPPGMEHLLRSEKRVKSLDRTGSMREESRRSFFSPSAAPHYPEPSIAAPVIHTPAHTAERKSIAEQSDAALPASDPGTVVTASIMTTSLVSPTSSSADKSSRPVRRAISAASDRASKMEYLRETWRRRKELLIQNEAYFPTAPDKADDAHSSTEVTAKESAANDNDGDGGPPPAGHKSKIKHSIRSRISHLKQALKKNGKAEESPQQSKAAEKANGSSSESIVGSMTAADKPVITPAYISAQAAAEKKVLKTIESILQKTAAPTEAESLTKPAHALQSGFSDTSPGAKPSMLVKPCPRDPSPDEATSTSIAQPLETLQEDEAKAVSPERKPGLRVTSPVRGDASKEKLQQVRANIRQKKERWRSLSLN